MVMVFAAVAAAAAAQHQQKNDDQPDAGTVVVKTHVFHLTCSSLEHYMAATCRRNIVRR